MDKEEQHNAKEAFKTLKTILPLHNDFDAYVLAVIDWGCSEHPKPNPEDFGINNP